MGAGVWLDLARGGSVSVAVLWKLSVFFFLVGIFCCCCISSFFFVMEFAGCMWALRSGGDAAVVKEGVLPRLGCEFLSCRGLFVDFRGVVRELQGSGCKFVCFRVLFVNVVGCVCVQIDHVRSSVCFNVVGACTVLGY